MSKNTDASQTPKSRKNFINRELSWLSFARRVLSQVSTEELPLLERVKFAGIVGMLLGHRDPKTTARYSHIADSPAKVAADRISGSIASAMKGEAEGAEVVELSRRSE